MSAATDIDFGESVQGRMDTSGAELPTGGRASSGYIPSFYLRDPHKGPALDAVVTDGGKPVQANGETLTVRKCPPAFRYAIGPAKGGEAELLSVQEFWRLYEQATVEYYREQCRQPYDVANIQYEPHPTPRDFAAKKWNSDRTKVIPLGAEVESQAPEEEPALLYSPTTDRLISREELDAMKQAQQAKEEGLAAENRELRERLAAIEARLAQPTPEPKARKPKPEQPIVVAPCGRECKGTFGMKAHARNCDACKAASAEA